ncbi:MAG: formate dehydrogenase accessory sulfurtransferase FdhD [Acidobacteriota bacterium]
MPEKQVPVARWEGGRAQAASDSLGAEEPVEIRVEYSFKDRREIATLGLTLASPGQEEDLACGLLHAEGWLTGAAQIEGIHVQPGSVLVALRPGVEPVATARRHLARTAACGLCGREDLPGLGSPPEASAVTLPIGLLYALPGRLAAAQPAFQRTGALHAAALFTPAGELLALREDIGRHNALDKLIGHRLRTGQLPLAGHIVLLSGRAGYELLQKCAAAQATIVAAIGAPSTMAVELARRHHITLVGFLRRERCNVYTHPHRIVANPAGAPG